MNDLERFLAAEDADEILASITRMIAPKATAPTMATINRDWPEEDMSRTLMGHVNRNPLRLLLDGCAVPETMMMAEMMELLHMAWKRQDPLPNHPLASFVRALLNKPKTAGQRRLDVVRSQGFLASKTPALHRVACHAVLDPQDLHEVEVSGWPFVPHGPVQMRRYRILDSEGRMDALPLTIDGQATGGVVLEAIACLPLTGDKGAALRSDLRRFGDMVFAASACFEATARELIETAGWGGSPVSNIARLNRLLVCARFIQVDLGKGLLRLYDLIVTGGYGLDARYAIAPGSWWQGGADTGEANAWRLSGGLWRPALGDAKQGREAWALPDAMIAGIEAAL
ncbi:MAG: hypothetical protein F4Y68_03435, partial [Boseongicola sp. SB0665_bin_10]|nr:hypothetical protein [Boseongicola sp. SB0665_bin_10]